VSFIRLQSISSKARYFQRPARTRSNQRGLLEAVGATQGFSEAKVRGKHEEQHATGRFVSGDLVRCRDYHSFRRDGCGSARIKAFLDGNAILSDQHFRAPRRTIFTFFVSISPQRINCNDQVYRHVPILDHSRSACRRRGHRWRDRHPISEPPSAEIDSSSLRSASYLHELDQWSGQYNQDRNIDRTIISNAVGRLCAVDFSAGILEQSWSVAGYRTMERPLMPRLLLAVVVLIAPISG
jgi:hypothetical protein